MLETGRIAPRRNEPPHLWIEYCIRGRPSSFSLSLANPRLRLALSRTGCRIDVQSEASSGRQSSGWSGERSVVRIVGPTSEAIAEVNATLDEVNSRYRRRKFRGSHPSVTSLQVDVHQVMLSYCKTLDNMVCPCDIGSQSGCGSCIKASQANDATSLFQSVFSKANHGIQMIDKKSFPSASVTLRQEFCQSAPGIRQNRGSSNVEIAEVPRPYLTSPTKPNYRRNMPSRTQKDNKLAYSAKKQSQVSKTPNEEGITCIRMKRNAGDSESDFHLVQSTGFSLNRLNKSPTRITLHATDRNSTDRFIKKRHLLERNSPNIPNYSDITRDLVYSYLQNVDPIRLHAIIREFTNKDDLSLDLENISMSRDLDIETRFSTASESLQVEPELTYSTLSEINSLASCGSGNIKFRKSGQHPTNDERVFAVDALSDSLDTCYNPSRNIHSRSPLRLAQKINNLINIMHPDIVEPPRQVKEAHLFTETDTEQCHSLRISNPMNSAKVIVVANPPLEFQEKQMQFPAIIVTVTVMDRIHDQLIHFNNPLTSVQFHEYIPPSMSMSCNVRETQINNITIVPPPKLPLTDCDLRLVHKDGILLQKIPEHVAETVKDLSTVEADTFIRNGAIRVDNFLRRSEAAPQKWSHYLLLKRQQSLGDGISCRQPAYSEAVQETEVDKDELQLPKPVNDSSTPSPRLLFQNSQKNSRSSPASRLPLYQSTRPMTTQASPDAHSLLKPAPKESLPLLTTFTASQLSQLLTDDDMHHNRKILRRLINLTSKHNSILKAIHSRLSATVEPKEVQKQPLTERKLSTHLLQPCHKLTSVVGRTNSAPGLRSSMSTGSSPDQCEKMRSKGHYYTVNENKVFDRMGELVGTLGFNCREWSEKSKNMYANQHHQMGYTVSQPTADDVNPVRKTHHVKSDSNPVMEAIPVSSVIHSKPLVFPPNGLRDQKPGLNVRHYHPNHMIHTGASRHLANPSICRRNVNNPCLSRCHHGWRSKSIPSHSFVGHRIPVKQTNRVTHFTPRVYPAGYPCCSY